jgi:hypothetical protein
VGRETIGVYLAVAAGMIVVNLLFHQAAMLVVTGDGSHPEGSWPSSWPCTTTDTRSPAVVFCLLLVALGHLAYHSTRYPRTLSTFLIVSFIGD